MRIQEEIRQGAFQSCAQSAIHGKPRAGDLRRARHVKNARALADFPMRPRREVEFRRRAPAANLDIRGSVPAYRDRRVRKIRHRQHELIEPSIELGDSFIGPLDLFRDALHLGEQIVGFFACALAARDLFAGTVAFGLGPFGCSDAFAPLAIERAKSLEINQRAAICGHLLELRKMLAKIIQIMHGPRGYRKHRRPPNHSHAAPRT